MRNLLVLFIGVLFILSGCNQESEKDPYKSNTDPNRISGAYGQPMESEIMFLWFLSNHYLKGVTKTHAFIRGYTTMHENPMYTIFTEEMKAQYSDVFAPKSVNKLLKYNARFSNLNDLLLHYFEDKQEVDPSDLDQIKEMANAVIYEISTMDGGGSADLALYNLISNPYAFEDLSDEEISEHLTTVDNLLYSLESFLSK